MPEYSVNGPLERIEHIKSHLYHDGGFPIANAVKNIETNSGSPTGSARGLASHAEASAMYAWFVDKDLKAMRQWCFVNAKLRQFICKNNPKSHFNRSMTAYDLIHPLLSNNEAIIKWFANNEDAYDLKRIENHKTFDFWEYQALVAIRGDWHRLEKRCNLVLSDPPANKMLMKKINDHHFYLALAKGDTEGMQKAISEIVDPKAVKLLSEADGGYKQDLISTIAVILSKIAWRHGYEINPNSRFVPEEWLPNTPLEEYQPHYSFLQVE